MVKITIRVPVYKLKRFFRGLRSGVHRAKITIRIKAGWLRYFRENLGAPFIIAFQIMLLACAGLLVRGNSALANEVAIYAYYSLVMGVVLQLICFIKHGEKAAE